MGELETAKRKAQSYQWSGSHDLQGNIEGIVIFSLEQRTLTDDIIAVLKASKSCIGTGSQLSISDRTEITVLNLTRKK